MTLADQITLLEQAYKTNSKHLMFKIDFGVNDDSILTKFVKPWIGGPHIVSFHKGVTCKVSTDSYGVFQCILDEALRSPFQNTLSVSFSRSN